MQPQVCVPVLDVSDTGRRYRGQEAVTFDPAQRPDAGVTWQRPAGGSMAAGQMGRLNMGQQLTCKCSRDQR